MPQLLVLPVGEVGHFILKGIIQVKMIVRVLQFLGCQCFMKLTIMVLYLANSFRDFLFFISPLFTQASNSQQILQRLLKFLALMNKSKMVLECKVLHGHFDIRQHPLTPSFCFFGAMRLC